MKRMILSFIISSMLISGITISASAEENFNEVNSQEMIEADSAIEDYSESGEDVVAYAIDDESIEQAFDVSGYDLSQSYKSYSIKGLMIDDYKKNNDFASLISEDYLVFVPADNMLISLKLNDESGELKVICTEEYGDDYVNLLEEGEKITQNIDEEIIEIKNAEAFMYYLNIIYIKTTENEYVVPYFSGMINQDIAGRIENGKLYKTDDFMKAMENTFDIDSLDPESDGGVPIKPLSNQAGLSVASATGTDDLNSDTNNYFMIYAIAAGVIIIGGGIGIFINEKKRKNK